MIRFEISPYTGTFNEGEVSIDSTSPIAAELQESLQEEIDFRRKVTEGYAPNADALMLDILKVWQAKIVETSKPEDAPDGAVY